MTHSIIAYFHKYDWLCHLATFIIGIYHKQQNLCERKVSRFNGIYHSVEKTFAIHRKFTKVFSHVTFVIYSMKKGGQVTKPIILVKICYNYCVSFKELNI